MHAQSAKHLIRKGLRMKSVQLGLAVLINIILFPKTRTSICDKI
ncbi:hypothetical protein HMPREF9406_0700 [Clostridium sp. HGF2]|nr:hypothetical protein HMPREF9406_0700 [Clostridium sp. HGF2]